MAVNPNAGKNQGPDRQEKPGKQESSIDSSASATMKDAANFVSDKARAAASSVGHAASDAASYVGHRAEDATAAMGSGLQSFGNTIRDYGSRSDMLGNATEAVAGGVESAGRYLEEQGLSGIAEDVTAVVRRNPIPALFVAAGIGFLLARATSSRS